MGNNEKKGMGQIMNQVKVFGKNEVIFREGDYAQCMYEIQSGSVNIYADFAFFSTRSLSADGIVSDCNRDEINVRNAMLKHAKCKVFLCDSSKFDSAAGYIQCTLQDLDVMISEEDTASVYGERFPKLRIF